MPFCDTLSIALSTRQRVREVSHTGFTPPRGRGKLAGVTQRRLCAAVMGGTLMILAVVDDLIFLSKIQETAKILGVSVEAVGVPVAGSRVRESNASGLLIDLNHRSGTAVEVIERLKSDPAAAAVPVVGFLSHVQAELADSARRAGCDIVLPRSAFVKQLAQVLEKLDDKKAASAPPSNQDPGLK